MTLSFTDRVFVGFWINWAQGRVLGSTITLTSSGGTVLVAFLALFVQFTGSHLWDLICFFLYNLQLDNKSQYTDVFSRQRQVLLRNSGSPASTAFEFLKLGWYWRKNGRKPFQRTCGYFILGGVFMVGFLVAAIFSAYVVRTTNIEVLVQSSSCGTWMRPKPVTAKEAYADSFTRATRNELQTSITESIQYSRGCYGETDDPTRCNDYASRNIKSTRFEHSACPFDESMCTTYPVVTFDSGYLDSMEIFGINAREEDRIKFRKVLSCTPLSQEGHVSEMKLTAGGLSMDMPNTTASVYHYGPHGLADINITLILDWIITNTTRDYIVDTYEDQAGQIDMDFTAIPELQRRDADVNVAFFLSNSVISLTPIDDPIFAAHRRMPTSNESLSVYAADFPATVLGCAEQYQFCNPKADRCGDLTGIVLAKKGFDSLELNSFQNATAYLFSQNVIWWENTVRQVGLQSSAPLVARNSLTGSFVQSGLPENHWTIEVEDWHNLFLARLQKLAVFHAAGPVDPNNAQYIVPPNGTAEEALCHAQKVRVNGNFSNVNVFALFFIIVFGCLIILTNIALSNLVRLRLRKQPHTANGQRAPWVQDGLLQIQRAAHEARDECEWIDANKGRSVPITKPGERVRQLWATMQTSATTFTTACTVSLTPGHAWKVSKAPTHASSVGSLRNGAPSRPMTVTSTGTQGIGGVGTSRLGGNAPPGPPALAVSQTSPTAQAPPTSSAVQGPPDLSTPRVAPAPHFSPTQRSMGNRTAAPVFHIERGLDRIARDVPFPGNLNEARPTRNTASRG
ncbi:hypothetical protein M501DRAFT_1000165 [Patellaria atrata CBS 101060]|uniref:Uncharacterized protein n=1 Tax=Patellaria atrata CBS 101060 TaxID=1346257 RepID=A0A9P4S2N7_9PEZI|nr:hypothetical protein M501DRAFT_1000165 [Patellaria atrata CBS 101060]